MGRLHPFADDSRSTQPCAAQARIHAAGRSAEIIRNLPWEATPLGALDSWDSEFVSHLSLVLEAHFPMFLTWGPGHHLFYNDAFESVLVGKGDCIGRPISAVFPEAWPQVRAYCEAALGGRSTYLEDLPIALVRNFTLSTTWWAVSYSPARGADGAVGGVLGVLYETTRRVASEETLRSREAALLAVTDTVPGLLWRADTKGRFMWANPALETYLGLEKPSDAFWNEFVHPEDMAASREVHDTCMLSGRPFECQQRLKKADGAWRWFIVRAQQIPDNEGNVTGWVGSASDIHDWRSGADKADETEGLVRRYHESEATLMWVGTVVSREIESLNPDTCATWALPDDGSPIVWETWLDFAHPDDRALLSTMFDRAAAGEVAQTRFRSPGPNGTVRRFHATAFAMPTGADGMRRVGGLIVEVASSDDPRIYLVDDRPAAQDSMAMALVRRGFRVRSFDDEAAFRKISADLAPGCVVLAVGDDIEPALKTASVLKADGRLPWIVTGALQDRLRDVVQFMKLGAADILNSPGPDDVAAAGHAALAIAFGKSTDTQAPANARQKIFELSPRERQVFDGLVKGGTNKTIGRDLNLSPRTVETHRAHVMDRLGVSTLAELVKLASEGGVTSKG
ncbi:PAS domain-containing protein [Brevundimonas staleyi]|uniref:PAS domain-containing protein n=1 Tax=Brevundimonas staleyi TaxID=74326 RepID=A0ABW0FNL6_9CAUL